MEFFKKRSTAWAVLAVVIVCSFFIGQSKKPTDEFVVLEPGVYVQDNANVLSSSTEDYITSLNNCLVSKVGAEIQVATVDTTAGEDIFDMAIELAQDTKLSANCCVFLVAVDDIGAVIVQGDDLIYAFSDNELSAILQRNFTASMFENRNVDDAVKSSFNDLITMYEDYYNVSITPMANIIHESGADSSDADATAVMLFVLIIVMLVLYVTVRAITRPRRPRRTVFIPTGGVGTPPPPKTGNYPPRGSYTTPPPYSGGNSRSGGFGTSSTKGGSFSSSSRSGSFGSSSRGASFGGSSRSGSFGGGSRGGSFGGGSRGGSFRK